jgi:hypothetical protein
MARWEHCVGSIAAASGGETSGGGAPLRGHPFFRLGEQLGVANGDVEELGVRGTEAPGAQGEDDLGEGGTAEVTDRMWIADHGQSSHRSSRSTSVTLPLRIEFVNRKPQDVGGECRCVGGLGQSKRTAEAVLLVLRRYRWFRGPGRSRPASPWGRGSR